MPFATDGYQAQGIHSIDERVRFDWFNDGGVLVQRITFEPDAPAKPLTQFVRSDHAKPSTIGGYRSDPAT